MTLLGMQLGMLDAVEKTVNDERPPDGYLHLETRIHQLGLQVCIGNDWESMLCKLTWEQWDQLVKFVEDIRRKAK